jgi:D-alanyl-D-alanine carboxypeptidase
MVTSKQCLAKYGDPYTNEGKFMVLWDVPPNLELGHIPKKIYCNHDLIHPLTLALNNVISRGLVSQIKTWDGCFNRRQKRGGTSMSLHSWGIAIDINAAWNQFGKTPTMSPELVKCFTDAGFDWGGTWKKPDGMHLQLAGI